MLGTIQVDLDGLWTYRQYLGFEAKDAAADPIYTEAVPLFLDLFERYSVKATFFIVGKDTEHVEHRRIIAKIIAKGHEIANHSLSHLPNFSKMLTKNLEQEILISDELIQKINGRQIYGFRAPMYSVDKRVLSILAKNGYVYDSSVMPSFINSAAMNIGHCIMQKGIVELDAGRFSFGFAPLGVYNPDQDSLWKMGQMKLFEVSISVLPRWRIPMHSSYIFIFGKQYFDYGLRQLEEIGVSVVYLFHGIDLVDLEMQDVKLPFSKPLSSRQDTCEHIVQRLSQSYQLCTTYELVNKVKG